MKCVRYTNNDLILEGRVASVNEYSKDKAANITLAIDNGKDKDGNKKEPFYIQTKSFTPAAYNSVRTGMKIRIYGHVAPNNYEKDGGEKVYGTDLIADFIDFLESKATVEAREAAKGN